MVNNLTMLAYYHMKIPISLCQFDRIFYKEWLPFFTWTISSKSLFVQLLHFKWEFLTGRKLKNRQYNGQRKKGNKTNKSERLLFNANSAIFQLYHCENKLIFNEMMMRSALYYTNTPHSYTLFWFQANQSLLFLFNAACLAEKQQLPIL